MAKAAALELGPENIRVNSVHPGMTRTPMTAHFPEQQLAAAIPLGRFGEPAEVAGVVAYAASSRSAFMTGAELVVDGGWIAR
jgi:3alpha(or 20beta)-hydroxysteroid dehydrogenase